MKYAIMPLNKIQDGRWRRLELF